MTMMLHAVGWGAVMVPLVLAVFLASRVLHFDDFSIEGSFASGGAWSGLAMVCGVSWWQSLIIVLCGGILIGLVTTFLHTLLKIDRLLSGIIVTTALFSCNLKLVGAQLVLNKTLFSSGPIAIVSDMMPWQFVFLGIAIVIITGCWLLLKTEIGLCLWTVGDNEHFLTQLGKSVILYRGIGLAFTNMLAAFAGFLMVQRMGYFSITGSIGILMSGLAAVVIGKALCGPRIIGVLIGAFVYQMTIALVVAAHIDPAWTKLATALLVIFWLACEQFRLDGSVT